MIGQNHPEASPMIASESLVSRIPVFGRKDVSSPKISVRSHFPQKETKSKTIDLSKNPFGQYLKSHSVGPMVCKCCHVLVADDDQLQHLFYQNLFEKSKDSEKELKNQSLLVELFASGEDLLDKYLRMKLCGCNKLKMVITDYQMGKDRLNGAETAQRLRLAGYTGNLLMRTSESLEDLKTEHPGLEKMIDCLIGKRDIKLGKEIILKFMQQKQKSI